MLCRIPSFIQVCLMLEGSDGIFMINSKMGDRKL